MAELLLVEDDDTLGMTLEVTLAAMGHVIRWCRSLESARASIRAHPPDLVLLDLGLPDGHGLELCREVRAGGSIVPIVVLTAQGTGVSLGRCGIDESVLTSLHDQRGRRHGRCAV